MAKKKDKNEVTVTAGGRRICPDCELQFRLKERFDEHRATGCKPSRADGQTWSEVDPEAVDTPEDSQAQS